MSFASRFVRAHRVSTALFGFVSISVAFTSQARAHIDVTSVEPRGGNGSDQKTGPCPDLPRGEPIEFEAGSTITLEWTETIDHEGLFIVSFDPDGDDFDGDGDGNYDFPASLSGGDEASGNGDLVLMEIQDEGGSEHSAEVTLPSAACDNCTLQLMQNMGERTPTPANATAHLYFRCIDVVLVGGDEGNMGGNGGMAGGSPGGGGSGGALVGGFGGMLDGLGGTEPDPMNVAGMTFVPAGGGPGAPPANTAPSPTTGPMPVTPPPVSPEPDGDTPVAPPATDPLPTQPMGGNPAPTPSSSTAPDPSATGSTGAPDGAGDEGGCSVSPKKVSGRSTVAGFSLLALMSFAGWRRRRAQ